MPRSPKKLSSPTREKLARASKDRPKESPTKTSPRKSPTKTTPKKSPKKEEKKTPKKESSGVKSPKKSPSSSSKKNYSHPTYEAMIRRAIKEDATRKGTSYIAIYKFVDANFQVPANSSTHVRTNLKKLVEDGTLEHGATPQRYKLSAKAKQEDKKSTPKKTPTKKEPSSPRKSRSSKSEDSPSKKKKASKSEGDSPKKKSKSKERSSSPKKTPTKRSPKKEKESSSPSRSTRSAKKETTSPKKKTPTKKTTSPRGGVKKPETPKKTPTPKTPRGSAKKASPLSSPTSGGGASESGELKWVWQYYDNGYFNYNPTASAVVEGVYQEYLTSPYTTDVRSVKSGQWSYLVDFRQMTQQNVEHESHTQRKIRRVQIPSSQTGDLKKKYPGDDDLSS